MRVAFAWATRIACWTGILEDANVVVGPNTHAQHRTNNPPVRCKPVKDSTSVCGRQLVRWTRWRDCAVFSLHWSLVTRHSHWHLPLSQVFFTSVVLLSSQLVATYRPTYAARACWLLFGKNLILGS